MAKTAFVQEPVAIVGFACRLPGSSTSPSKLWELLQRGGVASNNVPENRFNIKGHYDGSTKPGTMRPCGGMFLENTDPADFDASFFEISTVEAVSMDPNQRQMLEVVYEGLENAGITLEALNGASVACLVGSYASDYGDIQGRDPENRQPYITVGGGRAILANRISHFLNIKGPSMTIDTACSGSLVGVDIACRYLGSGEINAAIVATSNLYLNPEHVMDAGGVGTAHSPTGICHTFDITADGYVKAEAVSSVILKRLSDAVRDGDPIRAVIRGSATNSDGRTAGIASPSPAAQAEAIRSAYKNAGIVDFNDTAYLECHGTGTPAGDPAEVGGASSVFSSSRSADKPLIIGSIKSNVGHAEPAAGISGLMKAVMAIEKGIIPGNPTFHNPNPKIDFANWNVKASRTAMPWPAGYKIKRASVNSFGYGGSNLHMVVEEPKLIREARHVSSYRSDHDDFFSDDEESTRPQILTFSANDETSMRAYCKALSGHLSNPRVKVSLADLAYTLSERRSRHFHRAYTVVRDTDLDEGAIVFGKQSMDKSRIGFVFTGQGAQWSQMGKSLLETFPSTESTLRELDEVLQSLPDAPSWSLLNELSEQRSAEHMRQPEFSQPLVTALQICILSVLAEWEIHPQSVVGHSSGEIAASYAAGLLSKADAIRAAFYRGRAAVNCQKEPKAAVGMLAVGLGAEAIQPFLETYRESSWIACLNSPNSVTISGHLSALENLKNDLVAENHFARLLQVDLAYHSQLMNDIGDHYEQILGREFNPLAGSGAVRMFSTVTGREQKDTVNAHYWKTNMVSPVRFEEALTEMISGQDAVNFLIEVGPAAALAGPVSQIKKAQSNQGTNVQYCASWSRGTDPAISTFDVAGRLFVAGYPVAMSKVNQYEQAETGHQPCTVVDLPNYVWNHSTKYWHEGESSRDWRFRKYLHHDLLGSKILGTPWSAPSFRKILRVDDVPWLREHKMGSDILLPGSGFIAMALEAMYQKSQATEPDGKVSSVNDLCYRCRNVRFEKALVVEEETELEITTTLTPQPGSKDWHEFRISSSKDGVHLEHCIGLIRIEDPVDEGIPEHDSGPLQHPTSGQLWYRAQTEIGYGFGPAFQKLLSVESTSGQRSSRSIVSLAEPPSKWSPQSRYPIHPASLDGCFQTVTPSLWAGERSSLNAVLVPAVIDSLIVNKVKPGLKEGISAATTEYSGRGRLDEAKSYFSNCSVWDPGDGALLMQLSGLHYAKLDTGAKQDSPHTFDRVEWKPDISFLTQDQLSHIQLEDSSSSKIERIVDLIAHKKPALKVLEVSLDDSGVSSIWLEAGDRSSRAAYLEYMFASPHAKALVGTQTRLESERNCSFSLINIETKGLSLPESTYDLAIIRSGSSPTIDVETLKTNLKPLLSEETYVVVTKQHISSSVSASSDGSMKPDSPRNGEESGSPNTDYSEPETPVDEIMNDPLDDKVNLILRYGEPLDQSKAGARMWTGNHGSLLSVTGNNLFASVSVSVPQQPNTSGSRKLSIASFVKNAPAVPSDWMSLLEHSGWDVEEHSCPFQNIPPQSTVLVLDELTTPVLAQMDENQWNGVKTLVANGGALLWVTRGSQYKVSEPENALVHGLFRVIRMEDPSARLATLDVQSSTSPAAGQAINRVLDSLRAERPETFEEVEYAERDGIVHVQRLVPDAPVNKFRVDEESGLEAAVGSFRDTDKQVMLRVERLGTFDSLQFCETAPGEVAVEKNKVEVEIFAAGVNFKDVAVSMGVVPENEYTIGYEGAGFVRRVGTGVTNFKVGDRVCFLNNGSYSNRLQVSEGRVHCIPDWMSFEDAATIPSVYLATAYSLFNIANLQLGQSVLIHSASGGVGLSAIQLARYMNAEIFVTVSTEEKRKFLADNYGIPYDRMFSSRTTKFSKEILERTGGRGIDIILNSLTGEMLDESWRICADGGTMVEIGKKDIVDRNYLSMEPFDRNCSFRAMDFSYTKDISDELIASLLKRIFELIKGNHIKPIHPITTFGFDEIPAALTHIRSGRHIGKVVISSGEKQDLALPIRPAIQKLSLNPDASYLVVGGLKGLCGNLAIHLAILGAKKIIVCSRSGHGDDASKKVIKNCTARGCVVEEAKGDVTDADFVRKVFEKASPPISGLIQGAMILRDKPFETMTLEEYHAAILAKVRGTQNLHDVSLEQKRPLDFFTMLSSISGIIGKKGQVNYSAANTFLDAFAGYRNDMGLCANAVDLGLIEDVGYVAEQGGMDSHFDKRQWMPINEGLLRKILSYSILQQTEPINRESAAQLITGIAFPLPNDSDLIRDARFGYLFAPGMSSGAGSEGSKGSQGSRTLLLMHESGADQPAMVSAAIDLLGTQFTKILRLTTEMEPAKPLSVYGLDSLAAVELRNWIRMELGAELTTLDVTNASSLIALCEKLISKLPARDGASKP